MKDTSSSKNDFKFEQQDGLAPDVPEIHEEIIREQNEPHEGNERVPVWLFLVFIGMGMWGGWYTSEFDGGFNANVYDGPDAFRAVDYSQSSASAEPIDPVKLGKRVYNTCVTCHQTNGQGIAGKYPPLDGSEWVSMDERILARIMLNGLSGPIEVQGQTYNNQMPSWKQLSDFEIAAVLSHVRSSWGNDYSPVAPSLVAQVRQETSEETQPYNPADLKTLAGELPPPLEIAESAILAEYKNATLSSTLETDESKWIRNLKDAYVLEQVLTLPGDAEKGSALFTTATCVTCHVGSEDVKPVGPPLAELATIEKREEIVDSILHPSAKIKEGYEGYKLMIFDGTFVAGAIVEETEDFIKLRKSTGETVEIDALDVDARVKDTVSPMPNGLVDTLSIAQLADLVAYVDSLEPAPGSETETPSSKEAAEEPAPVEGE